MSRIGRKPITLPKGVEVKIETGNLITVKGAKGSLTRQLSPSILFEKTETGFQVNRPDDSNQSRALHGLNRTLFDNMITGVSQGYRRDLEIAGVGYRALKDGNDLVVLLGFSHAIKLQPPEGITFGVEGTTKVFVSGIDKELVGAQAARIRALRPPEPYKGKGIKYAGEIIRRKAGKAGKAGKK